MSGEFTYFRKYIILKNNYTNIEGIKPKGHGKIEVKGVKGTVNLSVENCEPYGDYRVYFLRDINGQIKEYDLGRIIIDERGRTRTDINFNVRDLDSIGFAMNRINAILIGKDRKILLNGYMDKDDGTVDRFVKQLISEKEVEQKQDSEPIQEVEEKTEDLSIEENPEESVDMDQVEQLEDDFETKGVEEYAKIEETVDAEEAVEIEEAIEPEETEEDMESEEIVEEVEELEEAIESEKITEEVVELEKTQEVDEIEEEPIVDKGLDYQSLEYIRQLNHKNQMTDYILSILRFFPYVDPFKIYLHGYSWWQIEDCNTDLHKGFLPYYNYLMSTDYRHSTINNSITCIDLIRKYGHYIFGMYKEQKEVKYYLYGVPGKFIIEEHPFKGTTGFNTWYESKDGLGYWILYIDPMTGKVIRIINPMIPEY